MGAFDNDYFLGYVNEVTPQYVKIHFPSSHLLGQFRHRGSVYAGGNVGNFVAIEGDEYGFIARIIELELPDSERKEISEKAIHQDSTRFHPSGKAELLLVFNLFEPAKAVKTISKYPCIGAKVYACSDDLISLYVKDFGKKNDEEYNVFAELGSLTSNDSPCCVSFNALFGRHCAVVGTTGGGKSWTVAKLIEEIRDKTDNKVILVDATGEYDGIGDCDCIVGKNAFFSYKVLTNSEFCFLFRESSPNTSSILCEAINTLKLVNLGELESGDKIGKNAIEINNLTANNVKKFAGCDFDISNLPAQIKNECVKQGRTGLYEADDFKLGYCSHLISRIALFLQNDVVKNALGVGDRGDKEEITSIIDGFVQGNEKRVLRISFESLSFDLAIREIVVDFIAGHLLKESRKNVFKDSPIIFCIDEAHQFLNKRFSADDDTSFYLQNIDNIAKESRKYGLFLCLSTQMPRDIPIGTLSQMGTFIVHRLINDQDKKSIENASSAANRNALSFLPILGEGEAIMVGVDFPMPLMLKINAPLPQNQPNSDTPRIKKKKL